MELSQCERACAEPRAGSAYRALLSPLIVCASMQCEAAEPPLSPAVRVYPIKTVRLIVAAPPGGSADRLGRLIASKLSEAWTPGVVVDNRPGANGIIGTEMTARAAPDGYTLALVAAGVVINPSLYRVPYDPVQDFAPVTQLVSVPSVLVVNASFPVASVGELIAQARARPGAIVFGSAGRGSAGHLALELFQIVSSSRFTHVPQ
jgi:tripartite-type tricarboxylate transporter receptor subunit TctC